MNKIQNFIFYSIIFKYKTMQKFIVFIFLIAISYLNAQGLNSNAEFIKNSYSNEYETIIKKHAVEKWESNHKMIVYEINKQSDALFQIVKSFDSTNSEIMIKALEKWSFEGFETKNYSIIKKMQTLSFGVLVRLHCNWSMVKYEYDNQVKAKYSY